MLIRLKYLFVTHIVRMYCRPDPDFSQTRGRQEIE